MSDSQIGGIQIVRVYMTDNGIGDKPATQLWVAAVPREQAVAAVKKVIPADWIAELTNQRLSAKHIASLKLRPGDVRELSSAR